MKPVKSRRTLLWGTTILSSFLLLWTSSHASAEELLTTEGTQRSGHIDLLDKDTMNYYMNPDCREDFDVVVLFYAQWCTNCRALSPIYIRIAELLNAGSTSSSLVLGYFDCEADMEHATICSEAGITHYPTIQFYSLSGQHLPSAVSSTLPTHATQFAGNWQQGEAILDWIKAMSFLSRWHRAGWGEKLRRWLFSKKKKTDAALPVGIPPVAAAARQAETLQLESTTMRDLAIRTSSFVDAVLLPIHQMEPTMADGHGPRYTDVFAYLSQSNNGWKASNDEDTSVAVLRTCAMEAALDICQRLTTQLTEEWVAKQPIPHVEYITEEQLSHFTEDLNHAVAMREPFCTIINDCIREDYQPAGCQPVVCPFEDPVGCRYAGACLTETVQKDYATALGVPVPPTGGYTYRPVAAGMRGGQGFDAAVPPPNEEAEASSADEASATRENSYKWGL